MKIATHHNLAVVEDAPKARWRRIVGGRSAASATWALISRDQECDSGEGGALLVNS